MGHYSLMVCGFHYRCAWNRHCQIIYSTFSPLFVRAFSAFATIFRITISSQHTYNSAVEKCNCWENWSNTHVVVLGRFWYASWWIRSYVMPPRRLLRDKFKTLKFVSRLWWEEVAKRGRCALKIINLSGRWWIQIQGHGNQKGPIYQEALTVGCWRLWVIKTDLTPKENVSISVRG